MNFNFFSLFKTKNKKNKLIIPDTILVKKLKSISKDNGYRVLEDITIFHHSNKIYIPFIILDPKRGIYIFEYKDWTYEDLNNYEIKRSQNNEPSKNTLAYDKINSFINIKFNEILHNDCVKTFNYLLTENLSFADYEHLCDEKKELLPNDKIIFSDSDEDDILKKLHNSSNIDLNIPDADFIIANLLTQYLVLDEDFVYLATKEQIAFISDNLKYDNNDNIVSLNGLASSGKTTSIILKAIYLKLISKENSVTIIEPTTLSCDIVKQSILKLIEYSIVNIDITSINVMTPDEFLNAKTTSYVLCDDASLIENSIIDKIISKSSKSKLILINPTERYEHYYKLTKSFHKKTDMEFIKYDSYNKTIELIEDYSKSDKIDTILTISSESNKERLHDDLDSLKNDSIVVLDGSKKLIDQVEGSISICDYKDMNTLRSQIVILLDVCEISQEELSYAINLANEKVYILYEDECQSIITLKKIFNKE